VPSHAFCRAVALLVFGTAVMLTPSQAAAQDLFELEVFNYGGVAPGEYEIELHTNSMSRGSVTASSAAANHRPTHLSVEVTRGWKDRLETAVFVQTAPFGSAGSARFAGGHIRGKVRLGQPTRLPVRIAVSAEYAFNRRTFDDELQTAEFRSIVDYERGKLSVAVNPSIELVTRGSSDGLAPVFDVSARAAWQLTRRLALTTDYFSAAATTRHLQPEVDAHHLMFGGVDFDFSRAWEVSVSTGHCVTSSEPWMLKSVVGFRF
jgi:hypothetical protein